MSDTKSRSLWARRVRSWRRSLRDDAGFALRLAASYLVFGVVWIVVSDRAVASLVSDAALLSTLQTAKGWMFVVVTGGFLYVLAWWMVRTRRRLEAKNRESKRFLDTLTENLPGAVYVCANDEAWTMSYLSSGVEALTGYSAEELTAQGPPTYASLIHADDRADVRRQVDVGVGARRPFQAEYRIRTRSGDVRWVWEQGQGVFDEDGDGRLLRLEGFIANVTERRRGQERIRRQMSQLRALRAIDLAIMGSLDLRITLGVVLDQVTAQLGVDAAAVLVFHPDREVLERSAGRGLLPDSRLRTRLRPGEGPAGRAALRRETVRVDDIAACPDGGFDWLAEDEPFIAYIAMPLVAQGKLRGVLELLHPAPLPDDEAWAEFLETLAGQTAIAIANAELLTGLQRANAELRVAYDQAIEGWARALDLRDHETEGHSRRVMELAVLLAEQMDVPHDELVHIRRGALLHDIGKIGIPDAILLKPGPLTDVESAQMRRHAQYAVDLLSPIPFLEPALAIPHHHHERWDGKGYPDGLAGEQIPFAARIFAVADVWDALRSDRPYRSAWPEDRVRAHIRHQSGRHFDPAVVETFLAIDPEEIERIERGTRREPALSLREH